jgi:hypothetical protein
MKRVISLSLVLVTLIWKLKEMILQEGNLLEQDISVMIQGLNGKLDTGVAINGEQVVR